MSSALSKKQLISLLILLGLIFVLPLSLLLTKQRQEVRKKAAGTRKEIKITLDPANRATLQVNDSFVVKVMLKNVATGERKIRVAGTEIKFDPAALTILKENISCGPSSSLSSPAFTDIINNDTIRVICFKPGQAAPNLPLSIAAGETIELGHFTVTSKTSNGTNLIFTRTNIPEESTLEDLADAGTPAHYGPGGTATPTIPAPTNTPGPTSTPTPTSPPGPTNTPAPTNTPGPTSTPTPTVPPGTCPDGDKGNLNCDSQGLINEGDLGILIFKWAPYGPVPTPEPGQHSADIIINGKVDEGDLGRLIFFWKTQP